MPSLIFRQLFEPISCTYTYILGCSTSKQALIIDPVLETIERDIKLIRELGLNIICGLNTHVHADHVTGTGQLKRPENFPRMKSLISAKPLQWNTVFGKVDTLLEHGTTLRWGKQNLRKLQVLETPGHTNGCVTYVSHEDRMAFTGDALLIRGCGRTDLQQGDSRTLYQSVHSQILSLPSDYLLYPGHDYAGQTVTSVEEELNFNPRFTLPEDKFVQLMDSLKLPFPKKIDEAVPANMVCGISDMMDEKLREKFFPETTKLTGPNNP